MPKTLRFSLLVWLCVVLCFGGLSRKLESAAPDKSWPTAPPEEQGFDSAELAGVVEEIDQQDLPVDSLQIVRNGVLILDAYFYPYIGDRPHDMASVTKSVTSTLIGIAIDQGLLTLDRN